MKFFVSLKKYLGYKKYFIIGGIHFKIYPENSIVPKHNNNFAPNSVFSGGGVMLPKVTIDNNRERGRRGHISKILEKKHHLTN